MLKCVVMFVFLAGGVYGQSAASVAFDAASLKVSDDLAGEVQQPFGCSGGPGSADPGQWVCHKASLSTLIFTAFQLRRYQPSLPGWMSTSYFDITAKIPRGATMDQIHLMQQDLLTTRFKLAVHFEEKEMQGFDLVVGKSGPKFKEAVDDPPDYTAPPGAKFTTWDSDGFPILPSGHEAVMSLVNGKIARRWRKADIGEVCAFLADQLQRPVNDASMLTSKYDMTLRFVAAAMPMPGTPVERDANGQVIPPFIVSSPTLKEAVEAQLGLHLEPRAVNAKIMAIDHVEKVPVAN